MDGWLTIKVIAEILDTKEDTILKKVKRGKFTKARKVKVTGRGSRGGVLWEVHIGDSAIPEKVRLAWLESQTETGVIEASLPPVPHESAISVTEHLGAPEIEALKRHQRQVMDARMFFIRKIEEAVGCKLHVRTAIESLMQQVQSDVSSDHFKEQVKKANARKGSGRTLSNSTLKKWWNAWVRSGKNPAALAPQSTERLPQTQLVEWVRTYSTGNAISSLPPGVPEWLPYVLDQYRKPQQPSVVEALRQMKRKAPAGLGIPSEDQVYRVFKKIPLIYLQKGRVTGAEYRALLGFVERDASDYDPLTICQIDGHSFKAYVAHPTTGAHFHPEVCGVICLNTKAIVGWSAGLAESWRTVADAIRHACTLNEDKIIGGIPAIIEPDRGSGNMAKVNSHESLGIFSRLGVTFLPSEVGGNPQERGGIERANQSVWVRAARDLPTYTGRDMDKSARKRVYKKLESDLKKIKARELLCAVEKTSEILLSWREFLDFLGEWVDRYNNTPHRALPMITAPLPDEPGGTPKRRHMTPKERYLQALVDGWRPVVYHGDMLEHLMMPHERIRVRREKFSLYGNSYHAYELRSWHGQDMLAAVNIHDPTEVIILDLEERPICVAKCNGNRRNARPVSMVEKAMVDRENRRTINLERKLEMVKRESQRPVIEVAPDNVELPAEVVAGEERRNQKLLTLAESRKLRDVTSPTDIYYMIQDRIKAGNSTSYQMKWLNDYEHWEETRKKIGLLKEDPYCLHDPEDFHE